MRPCLRGLVLFCESDFAFGVKGLISLMCVFITWGETSAVLHRNEHQEPWGDRANWDYWDGLHSVLFPSETRFRITIEGVRRGGLYVCLSCDQTTEVTGRRQLLGLGLVKNSEILVTVEHQRQRRWCKHVRWTLLCADRLKMAPTNPLLTRSPD